MSPPARTTKLPVVTADLTGRTVIVLGANVGLGFEASKHFATMKPEMLVLACRDLAKGQAALEKIQIETGYNKAVVWNIDLSSFASVSAFADKIDSELDRLDIIVQNAAVSMFTCEQTADGWETMLQVNYLSQALLALRVLPILVRTGKLANSPTPRLVLVTSRLGKRTTWEDSLVRSSEGLLKTLNKNDYLPADEMSFARYSETKVLEMFLTRSLHAHLQVPSPGPPPIVTCVCPDLCVSELRRDFPPQLKERYRHMEETSAYTTEEGSRQLVFGAVGDVVGKGADGLRGEYIEDHAVASTGAFVGSETGQAAQGVAWDETLDILDGVDSKLKNIRGAFLGQYIG